MQHPENLNASHPEDPDLATPPARRNTKPPLWSTKTHPAAAPRKPAAEAAGAAATHQPGASPEEADASPPPQSLADVDQLIARASQGDAAAADAVQRFFADEQNPLWRDAGNLAAAARKALAAKGFPGKPAHALSVDCYGKDLLKQLSDDDATPLEKLMIERLVVAWMFSGMVDLIIAAGGGESLISAKHVKAQELAEKRLQAALRSFQLARQICRGAAGGPLQLVGAKPASGSPSSTKQAAA